MQLNFENVSDDVLGHNKNPAGRLAKIYKVFTSIINTIGYLVMQENVKSPNPKHQPLRGLYHIDLSFLCLTNIITFFSSFYFSLLFIHYL